LPSLARRFLAVALLAVAYPSCQFQLYDPLRVDQVDTASGSQPLAKDLSAPSAYRLRDESRTILANFIDRDPTESPNQLFLTEPYQPGKIPVLLVHGLLSDAFTWVELVNELRATPGFVDRFQVWGFRYDTGRPFLASAASLRAQLSVWSMRGTRKRKAIPWRLRKSSAS
jgi:hypothetical protein